MTVPQALGTDCWTKKGPAGSCGGALAFEACTPAEYCRRSWNLGLGFCSVLFCYPRALLRSVLLSSVSVVLCSIFICELECAVLAETSLCHDQKTSVMKKGPAGSWGGALAFEACTPAEYCRRGVGSL